MTNDGAFVFSTTENSRMLQEEQNFDEENYDAVPEFDDEEEEVAADYVDQTTSEASFIRRSHRIAGSPGLGSFQAEVGMGSIRVSGLRRSARLRQT